MKQKLDQLIFLILRSIKSNISVRSIFKLKRMDIESFFCSSKGEVICTFSDFCFLALCFDELIFVQAWIIRMSI